MTSFLEHVEFLMGSSQDHSGDRVLDRWTSLKVPDRDSDEVASELPEVADASYQESVLDLYRSHNTALRDKLIYRLLSDRKLQAIASPLHAVLASSASNEAISEELSDMMGYDELDMIVEILENRSLVAAELEGALKGPLDAATGGRDSGTGLTQTDAKRRMEEAFQRNAERPLFVGPTTDPPEVLPHVYSSSASGGNILSQSGQKFTLPVGTTRHTEGHYEEVIIPPAKKIPPRASERLISVGELDDLAKQSFPGYSSLNRMQSIIYPTAYRSNENMLVCAPTGAGKTDVAMLTILRVLDQHRSRSNPLPASIRRDDFKIIYVAPMKALAAEIVRKFSKRLQWLSIRVRELTGDMQLTKAEIAETQVIVTTPEKWDVVTRKPTGEGEIASKLKLLIIDEVHLLNEERGAVIETIVARTLRQVESSQSVIRIVGLSATLPNYVDVADFLSVSRQTGLFFFDSSFRPVPLEQRFIAVKGKPGSPQSRMNLDLVTYEKVSELVREGHQVMVFVHARKETVKAALALREAASKDSVLHEFSCEEHPNFGHFRREIGKSRNKEMKQLFDEGFGIHHAGMLRSDRTMMERMFSARAIKVLCCTATLAWGVNLPAHAVVIKGTQVYDSSKGSFVDLSVLDVLQVFGRAGRPGFETSGEGYICTTEDKLQHYLDAVTSQIPIESQFVKGMIDAMNAEISLGTVTTVHDAVRWLGYTYLFVRMQKTPTLYGVSYDDVKYDRTLDRKRHELVRAAARSLVEAKMINFDEDSSSFTINDLGRLAAKYYIHHKSIEIFNRELRTRMTEADVLSMVSLSTEFDQIQVRENETKELTQLLEIAPCNVKNAFENSSGKVRISGEASRNKQERPMTSRKRYLHVKARSMYFSKVISRGLSWKTLPWCQICNMSLRMLDASFEPFLKSPSAKSGPTRAPWLMGVSKAIEKRLWPFDQPLKQFNLKPDVYYGLEQWADDYSASELVRMSATEIGKLVHLNPIHGQAIWTLQNNFPQSKSLILCALSALMFSESTRTCVVPSRGLPGTDLSSRSGFGSKTMKKKVILQLSYLLLRQSTDRLDVAFVISVPEGQIPPFVTIRVVSERWMGSEDEIKVPFDDLVMPSRSNSHTPRLDLPFLSPSVLQNHILRELFAAKLRNLNAIQTQAFWSTVNTQSNALLCAPTGSGKSTLGHILTCETLARIPSQGYVLVIAPRHSIVTEWMSDLRGVPPVMGFSMKFVTGSGTLAPARSKEIRLTTSSHLVAALSEEKDLAHSYPGLQLVVLENLEQLDPYYELAISSLLRVIRTQPTRVVGFSASLNESGDLATFRPSDRDQSLNVAVHTFAIPHSAALFKAMARPASTAILSIRLNPAIVFVPSRTQCSSVALDLIVNCTLETGAGAGYLSPSVSPELQDPGLSNLLSNGVGILHLGMHKQDHATIMELYTGGIIQVLVVAREACWTLPVRAAAVVVMGTQYISIHEDGARRQLRDYTLEELVHMQGRAVRHGDMGHFHLFCQAEDKDTYMRFLEGGLPLESQLLRSDQLQQWYKHHRSRGHISSKHEGVQALSLTFLAQRIVSNPTYYDCKGTRDERLSQVVDELEELIEGQELHPDFSRTFGILTCTLFYGKQLLSFFYIYAKYFLRFCSRTVAAFNVSKSLQNEKRM
ncbi:Sec63-domain-containing protein [Lactarius indigo]|nr:Sec63-domain-containing protein [Lactarius indigo]